MIDQAETHRPALSRTGRQRITALFLVPTAALAVGVAVFEIARGSGVAEVALAASSGALVGAVLPVAAVLLACVAVYLIEGVYQLGAFPALIARVARNWDSRIEIIEEHQARGARFAGRMINALSNGFGWLLDRRT